MDERATVQLCVRRPTPPGSGTARCDAVLDVLAELVEAGRSIGRSPVGIAVGALGYVQPETGVILDATNLGVRNLPLGEIVAKTFDLPTVVIQDVTAAALGEMQFGAGAGARYATFLNVGTGIAVGLIFNGQVYQGAASRAGEIGHICSASAGRSATVAGVAASKLWPPARASRAWRSAPSLDKGQGYYSGWSTASLISSVPRSWRRPRGRAIASR